MSVMQINNPLIENYLAQFDCFSPEERQIVFTELRQKQSSEGFASEGLAEEDIRAKRRGNDYADQTEEERRAAAKRFIESWDGLLVGAPDMTMKEIRAERLERKYGK